MRPLTLTLAATAALLSGCQSEPEEGGACDYVAEDAPWDLPATAPEFALVPREVADGLMLPVTGQLEYAADSASDIIEATPSTGSTSFESSFTTSGTPRLSWVPGATGNDLLRCPSKLLLDGTIHFSTDDGFLDESWPATIESSAAPGGVASQAVLDPSTTGASALFNVTRATDAEEWETSFYDHRLYYNSCLGCGSLFMFGSITYQGQYEATRDGDIIDQRGFTVSLAAWEGSTAP